MGALPAIAPSRMCGYLMRIQVASIPPAHHGESLFAVPIMPSQLHSRRHAKAQWLLR